MESNPGMAGSGTPQRFNQHVVFASQSQGIPGISENDGISAVVRKHGETAAGRMISRGRQLDPEPAKHGRSRRVQPLAGKPPSGRRLRFQEQYAGAPLGQG
jgi:hypothetical protein